MQLSICSYRAHRIAAVTRCVLPGPRTSIVRGNYVRETSVKRRNKTVQELTRNVASKCFHFLCNNIDRTWLFNALTFARSLGRCWKRRLSASVFNTSLGTWRMLMHEKPCLIPILNPDTPRFCKKCRSRSDGFWKPAHLDLHCISLSMWICINIQN